jgi:hypothetical protein
MYALVEVFMKHTILVESVVTVNEESVESIIVNEKSTKSVAANEKPTESMTTNNESIESVTTNNESTESMTANEKPTESVTVNNESTESMTTNNESTESVTANEKPTESVTANEESTESITANEKSTKSVKAMNNVQLTVILKRENDLLDIILETQENARNAVLSRTWTDFESQQKMLETIADQFRSLEHERETLFPEQNNFYRAIATIDSKERTQLSELYRDIKFKTMRIKFNGESLLRYLEEAQKTVHMFVEAAFPDRRGTMYGKKGTQISADMRSLIVDTSI